MAEPAFEISKLAKLPKLSDTVYLETVNDIMQARDAGKTQRCAELCMEGMQLCIEAGVWHPENAVRCAIDDLLKFLAHLHLDAQVAEDKSQ